MPENKEFSPTWRHWELLKGRPVRPAGEMAEQEDSIEMSEAERSFCSCMNEPTRRCYGNLNGSESHAGHKKHSGGMAGKANKAESKVRLNK